MCAPYLLFAADTAAALARRAARGEPLFIAHRGHVYQRLANETGLPHWMIALLVIVLSALVTASFLAGPTFGLLVAAFTCVVYLVSPRLFRSSVSV